MIRLKSWTVAPVMALALFTAPSRDHIDCASATASYEAAVAKLRDAIGILKRCIERSRAGDKCAAEMQALDDLHDAFAEAVSDYDDACH